MNRRDFLHRAAGTLAGAVATSSLANLAVAEGGPQSSTPASNRKANLKLGTQHGDSDDILKVMAAFGVNHICAVPPSLEGEEQWSVDALTKKREHIESFGIKADALRLIHPSYISPKSEIEHIMMG